MASRWRKRLRSLRWVWRLALLVALADIAYLVYLWPDWQALANGPVPQSEFIARYLDERAKNPGLPALRWEPVPLHGIPEAMVRSVVVGEDARFFRHSGIDFRAFAEAMAWNWEHRRLRYGGSTISQQTVKNLFLSPSRNPLRKWHEVVLTWGMEYHLPKQRILEIYLNVAEFGRGVYGVEAAARHYWGIPAAHLSTRQCIELAASLPNPPEANPVTRTAAFRYRVARIVRYMDES